MSSSILLRLPESEVYYTGDTPPEWTRDVEQATRFPNMISAQVGFGGWAEQVPHERLEAVAFDPETGAVEFLGQVEPFTEVVPQPLAGTCELFASIRKASKYFGQFAGWRKVTSIIPASEGDAYCFRVACNAYTHRDLVFAVKLPTGHLMRLDRFEAAQPAPLRKVTL